MTEQTGEPFAATARRHARLRPRPAHRRAGRRRAAAQPSARRWPGTWCSCSSPARRATTAPAVMIDEGVLDAAGPRVWAAYGLHVMSGLCRAASFATRPGPLMAASSGLHRHGARRAAATPRGRTRGRPDRGRRRDGHRPADHGHPAVRRVRPGRAHRRDVPRPAPGATSSPSTATFEATVRTLQPAGPGAGPDGVGAARARQIAAAHGLRADVGFDEEYPVTVERRRAEAEFALAIPLPTCSAPTGPCCCPTR